MSDANCGTAIITGASSGIGAAFARQLAAQGYDLLLVARRADRLDVIAEEAHQRYGVNAEVLTADLARTDDLTRVERRIAASDNVTLLVNNAGFGTVGKFGDIALDKQLEMISVHVVASVRLTRAVLSQMIAHARGGIVNVSSPAAFIPTAGNVTYAATKAYLKVFAEALAFELKGTGVRVQVLIPGFTRTEFHDSLEYRQMDVRARIPKVMWMSADEVVTASLKSLERGKLYCIPGFQNRLMMLLAQIGFVRLLGTMLVSRFPELAAQPHVKSARSL